jgi:signal transduction histidine kinase
MIKNSITRFSHIACAKNIILQAVPSDISGIIVCDYDRIMQVLSNLIDNALKFTPARGIISVGVTLSSTEVQVFVQDTGPGIAKEKQEHIFERFSQIGTKNRVGLGLGLYISKMLIEAHHVDLPPLNRTTYFPFATLKN